MNKKNILVLCLTLITSTNTFSQSSKKIEAELLRQANDMAKLLMKRDYMRFVEYANPAIFKLEKTDKKGLADKMVQQDKAMRARGAAYRYIKFDKPARIIDTAGTLQCILPETVCTLTPKKDYISHNSVLAMSTDKGKHWVFTEVTRDNIQVLKTALPVISSKLVVPPGRTE